MREPVNMCPRLGRKSSGLKALQESPFLRSACCGVDQAGEEVSHDGDELGRNTRLYVYCGAQAGSVHGLRIKAWSGFTSIWCPMRQAKR